MGLSCTVYDLVIDVRHVHHIEHIVVEVAAQYTAKDVKRDVGPEQMVEVGGEGRGGEGGREGT